MCFHWLVLMFVGFVMYHDFHSLVSKWSVSIMCCVFLLHSIEEGRICDESRVFVGWC